MLDAECTVQGYGLARASIAFNGVWAGEYLVECTFRNILFSFDNARHMRHTWTGRACERLDEALVAHTSEPDLRVHSRFGLTALQRFLALGS